MTKTERAGLVYTTALLGAGAVAYIRGKRGYREIATDAALHGLVVGTGVNVVFLMNDSTRATQMLTAAQAMPNEGQKKCSEFGKVTKQGLALLSQIDPVRLYRAAKIGPVKISESPKNPYHVALPSE